MAKNQIEFIARGILTSGSRILLCQNLAEGYYFLPGGHVDFGEAAAAALERELAEEGAIRAKAGNCLFVLETAFDARKRRHHEINVVFHVELLEPPPDDIRSIEPQIGLEWIEMASLVDLDVRPDSIKAWLASGGQPGSCSWTTAM